MVNFFLILRFVNRTHCREDWKHQSENKVVGSIISCTPSSSRFISIRISARPHNITVIRVYASTTDHEDEDVEQSYEQPDSITAKIHKKDTLVVQGDSNAKVGPDAYQDWEGTVRMYSI